MLTVCTAWDHLDHSGRVHLARSTRCALLRDAPFCRIEGVARSYTYAPACIRFTVAAIVNSALSFVSGMSRSPNYGLAVDGELAARAVTKQLVLAPYRCCGS